MASRPPSERKPRLKTGPHRCLELRLCAVLRGLLIQRLLPGLRLARHDAVLPLGHHLHLLAGLDRPLDVDRRVALARLEVGRRPRRRRRRSW